MTEEIWKDVIGYEGRYQISNMGQLKGFGRSPKGVILNLSSSWNGYLTKNLYKNWDYQPIKIHRLVCQHFIENPENKPFINHKNGIKTDNRVENLEWCTFSENMLHAKRTGLSPSPHGENHAKAILTNEQVIYIRQTYQPRKVPKSHFAKKFGVSESAIAGILNNRNWKHLL